MVYTVRVVATNLIAGTVNISAKSEEEALAKAQERISPELKQDGYEFQFDILKAPDLVRLAA
jgi:hypothetical protein